MNVGWVAPGAGGYEHNAKLGHCGTGVVFVMRDVMLHRTPRPLAETLEESQGHGRIGIENNPCLRPANYLLQL